MFTIFPHVAGVWKGLGHLIAVVPYMAGIWDVIGCVVATVPYVAGIQVLMGRPCATISFQIVIPEHKVTVINVVKCRTRYCRLQEVDELQEMAMKGKESEAEKKLKQ